MSETERILRSKSISIEPRLEQNIQVASNFKDATADIEIKEVSKNTKPQKHNTGTRSGVDVSKSVLMKPKNEYLSNIVDEEDKTNDILEIGAVGGESFQRCGEDFITKIRPHNLYSRKNRNKNNYKSNLEDFYNYDEMITMRDSSIKETETSEVNRALNKITDYIINMCEKIINMENNINELQKEKQLLNVQGPNTSRNNNIKNDEKSNKMVDLRLEKYDGTVHAESFLAKFEICSKYNKWTDEDRLANLQCSLTGCAAQLLWDFGSQDIKTSQDLIDKLRARFASTQTVMHKTQLRCRRRAGNESINDLAAEIRRLVALAYPGPSTPIKESIAVDCFLDALNDREFSIKVREREPESLDQACSCALRLEACYSSSIMKESNERSRNNIRMAHETGIVEEKPNAIETRFLKMEKLIESLALQINKSKNNNEQGQIINNKNRKCYICGNLNHIAKYCQSRNFKSPRLYCTNCKKRNHDVNNCWFKKRNMNEPNFNASSYTHDNTKALITSGHIPSDKGAFISIKINNKQVLALLDTGSELSVIPKHFVLNNQINEVKQDIQAANGTIIEVLGETELSIKIDDVIYKLNCLVADNVNEIIIGLNWIRKNVTSWEFNKHQIKLINNKRPIKEYKRALNRPWIEANKLICVSPRCEINAQGKLIQNGIMEMNEQITEPRRINRTVLVVPLTKVTTLRNINYELKEVIIKAGTKFSTLKPATLIGHAKSLNSEQNKIDLQREVYEQIRDYNSREITREKTRYNMKVKVKEFSIGDWVLYLTPRRRINRNQKWISKYEGPFLVLDCIGNLNYRISKSKNANTKIVHVDKLKLYHGDKPQSWLHQDDSNSDNEHITNVMADLENSIENNESEKTQEHNS